MAAGQREDTNIGLIAPGPLDTFLKVHQHWVHGTYARRPIRIDNVALRAQLRGSNRAFAVSSTTTHAQSQPTMDTANVQLNHRSNGNRVTQAQVREAASRGPVCFECGWPLSGQHEKGGKERHKSGHGCQVPPHDVNPKLGEVRSARKVAYAAWLKRKRS